MKTIFRKSILVALLFGTTISYALETSKEGLHKVKNEESYRLDNQNHWSVKNAKGIVVYEQNDVKNLSLEGLQLKDGNYTLEKEKGFEIIITPFSIQDGKTTFYTQKASTIHKPVFRKDGNRVLVSQLALDAKPLTVILYYEDEVIFNDLVEGKSVLSRVYRLRKDIKGKYKIVMKANDRTYSKEFFL